MENNANPQTNGSTTAAKKQASKKYFKNLKEKRANLERNLKEKENCQKGNIPEQASKILKEEISNRIHRDIGYRLAQAERAKGGNHLKGENYGSNIKH